MSILVTLPGLLRALLAGVGGVDAAVHRAVDDLEAGEELLEALEDRRGEPRNKPPFPGAKGLFGQPTLINNVETLANIPAIVENGADWFAAKGTPESTGTKVFALTGQIVALSSVTTSTTLDASLTSMLRLSDDIGVMADRILEMSDQILIMADNIGLMADRILATQIIQGDNLQVIIDASLETQKNILLLFSMFL